MTNKQFLRRLKTLWPELAGGVSCNEIARRCGVDCRTITRVANGEHVPSALLLFEIANAIGCQIGDFFRVPQARSRQRLAAK